MSLKVYMIMSYDSFFSAYVIALKVHALKIKVTVDLEKRLCNVIMLILFHKLFKEFPVW